MKPNMTCFPTNGLTNKILAMIYRNIDNINIFRFYFETWVFNEIKRSTFGNITPYSMLKANNVSVEYVVLIFIAKE